MHVPVLLTRQVFVKGVPAPIVVLSGTVTSVTKAALFVQLASLVGRGVSAVAVDPEDIAVRVTSGAGVSVTDAGGSVATGAWVCVDVGTAGCSVPCGLQPISISITTTLENDFLIIESLLRISCQLLVSIGAAPQPFAFRT